MANGEQSGSGGRSDWRVRVATGVGAALGATLGLLAKSLGLDLGPWWGIIAYGVLIAVGILLGQLVGTLLFRRPSDK